MEVVIDVDLANFFGTIDHQVAHDMLSMKIKDTKFLRYISRMFKAGVLAEGELIVSDEGVPQGSLYKALHNPPYAKKVIMQSNSQFFH